MTQTRNEDAKCDNCPYFFWRKRPNPYRECRQTATIAQNHPFTVYGGDHEGCDPDFVCGSHPDFWIKDSDT